MSAVLSNEQAWLIPKTKDTSANPDKVSDKSHEEPMTKTELAEIADIREQMHQTSAAVMLLTKLQQVQAQPSNGGKWTTWIQTGVVCGMLIVTGTTRFVGGESDLKQQIALHDYQIKQKDESYRALEARVMSIEFIWARVRQDIAAYGLQIDAQTGSITQVKKRR